MSLSPERTPKKLPEIHAIPRISQAFADLSERARLLNVELDHSTIESLQEFYRRLADYGQHTNLVANVDPELVVRDHIVDSLTLLPSINEQAGKSDKSRLLDIGSGAGFPGLVLAIVKTDLEVCLVESIAKKARFLSECCSALRLEKRVSVEVVRAEELAHKTGFRQSFDIATARAVGPLSMIAELCLPLLKMGGVVLAQKSKAQAEGEIAAAERALSVLGGRLLEVVTPDKAATGKENVILKIEKVRQTPAEYPRSAARYKKDPL